MRSVFLSIFTFISAFSIEVFAIDFLESELLVQMECLQDSSISEIKEEKCYLNPEKICIADNKLCLNSDFFGLLALANVVQDEEGIYLGLYDYYTCDNCGRSYQSAPSECDCGSTSFTRHNQLPEDD